MKSGLQQVAIEKLEVAETFNIRRNVLYILSFANLEAVQYS